MALTKPKKYNKVQLPSISAYKQGDVIAFNRGPYWHYAIVELVVGDTIHMIEYAGTDAFNVSSNLSGSGGDKGVVRRSTKHLSPNEVWYVDVPAYKTLPVYEVLRRAQSMVGRGSYDVIKNNCEHLASYCKTGRGTSGQIKEAKSKMKQVVKALPVVIAILILTIVAIHLVNFVLSGLSSVLAAIACVFPVIRNAVMSLLKEVSCLPLTLTYYGVIPAFVVINYPELSNIDGPNAVIRFLVLVALLAMIYIVLSIISFLIHVIVFVITFVLNPVVCLLPGIGNMLLKFTYGLSWLIHLLAILQYKLFYNTAKHYWYDPL